MKLFNRAATLVDKNYLVVYEVYNRHVSLITPVLRGSYQLTSKGPADSPPPLSSMTDYVEKQVLDSLDTSEIGRHNNLTAHQLTPDSFSLVFLNIVRVL